MAAQLFTSLPELQAMVHTLAAEKDVFTFDVFDTLVVRRIHDPNLVKEPVAAYLARLIGERGMPVRTTLVREERDRIESRMRSRSLRVHGDAEAVFPVLIREWVRAFVQNPSEVEELSLQVEELECRMEERVLVARKEWKEVLQHLKEAGCTLIALSDMYLPSPILVRFLDSVGLGGLFDEVVSSADRIQSKASGAGYRWLFQKYGCSPKKWVHVGDNPFSDALVPDSFGITALNFRDVRERKRHSLLQRYFYTAAGKPFWTGRYVLQASLPLEGEVDPELAKDPLYREGLTLFGPLLCGFIASLAAETRRARIPVVYFLSREGWMFRDVWKRMAPILELEGPLPEVRYLHVSRKALTAASCGAMGLTLDVVELMLLPIENRDLRDIFRVCGLEEAPLRPYLAAYGLEEHPSISPHHKGFSKESWNALLDLLNHEGFQQEVRRQKAKDWEGLLAYLEELDYFQDDHVAFVDVGWLGSIQKFFDLCVSHREDRPVIHGHLVAASRRRPFHSHTHSQLSGWLYDNRKGDAYAGSMLMYQELFEEVCRPDLPGLLRYDPDVEGHRVFRSGDDRGFQLERTQTKAIASLHQGIFDVCERYATILSVSSIDPDKLRPWIAQSLALKMAFPKTSEVDVLRHHHHLNDLGREGGDVDSLSRKPPSRLWDLPLWKLRWVRGSRLKQFLLHQLYEMVTVHER